MTALRLHSLLLIAALGCSSRADLSTADLGKERTLEGTLEYRHADTKPEPRYKNDRSEDGPVSGEQTKGGETTPSLNDHDVRNPDGRKIIRTGRVELVVATYTEARAKIDALVAAAGGYVDATNVNHHQGEVSDATIVLRIPSTGLGKLLPQLREIGEVVAESTNAADITDQYVDVAARLASAQALEKRLLELAADRNGKVEDVLAVERELARVRGEIEGYEGHMRQWNDQIALSTLTLQLSTKRPEIVAAAAPTLTDRIGNGFAASLDALRDAGTWLVVHGIAVLPWLLLGLPFLVLLRRLGRRVKLPWAVARTRAPAPATSSGPPAAE